jgi:hypothetical protein
MDMIIWLMNLVTSSTSVGRPWECCLEKLNFMVTNKFGPHTHTHQPPDNRAEAKEMNGNGCERCHKPARRHFYFSSYCGFTHDTRSKDLGLLQ